MIDKKNYKENFISKTVTLKYIEIYNNRIKLYFHDENHYQNLRPIDKIFPQNDNNGYYITYINAKPIEKKKNNKHFKTISTHTILKQDIFNSIKKYIKRKRTLIGTYINATNILNILLAPFIFIQNYIKNFIEEEKKKEIINEGNIAIDKHLLNIGDYTKVYINPKNTDDYWVDTDFLYE